VCNISVSRQRLQLSVRRSSFSSQGTSVSVSVSASMVATIGGTSVGGAMAAHEDGKRIHMQICMKILNI
jgi:hypothetical protein